MIPSRRPPIWVLALWLVTATISTLCGIGGGLYAVPILHFLLGLELKTAIATSLPIVMVMTASGTVSEMSRADSALDWVLVFELSLGAFVGARIGKSLVDRLSGDVLRALFVVLLAIVGLRVFATPAHPASDPSTNAAVHTTFASYFVDELVILFGFLGGFVAPLFGIGGGLIVVPALYLGLHDVSYLTARASSTAMSTITSAQLAWMYLREGKLDRTSMTWMGAVALCGGVLGVAAVHQPGWDEVARLAMAITLVGIALRFAWELRPSARAARRSASET